MRYNGHMPGYDPYLELLGIPPDRRPPSHRELLGVGADETDVEKIEAAARKRHEHLGNYTISPQEEVAACAKRLLHEVGSALVALRNLLTSGRPHEEAKAPADGAMPPPLPPAVPVPPPVVTVAAGIPPTLEQAAAVGEAIPGDATVGDAAAAAGATSVPPGEPVFVEVATPEGAESTELGGIPPAWTRGLARARELFRGMAAGVRSIPRRLWGIVRWGDGLLRSIAGEENAILHRFLRVVAIALLVPAVAYAGLLALSGLANLRRAGPSPSEVASSPETGTVRIELSDPTAKVQVKVDGNVVDAAALKEPLRLPAGEHRLEVASGEFDPYARSFAVVGDANLVLSVRLQAKARPQPVRPDTGTVRIELSDPTAKVQVKVDGNVIGPAALKGPITLAAGRHRLEVTSEEFDDDASSFAVRAGTQEVLPVALKPKPPPPAVTGTVRIELSEPQAQVQVKVDGKPVDSAKLDEGLVLPAGDHRLEVTSGQFEGYTSSFTVRAGRQEVLRIPLTPKLPLGPPLAVAPFDAAQARRHQDSWGRHLGVPVETTNSAGMKFVLIPAGEFLMGSSDGRSDDKPPHKVRITKPFYLGQYEVTVGQFRQFVNESGYADAGERWETAFPSQTDAHPVVNVSWDAAKAFCDWLSKKEHKEYRLPTEAEWEYACRAGSAGKYCFGDDEAALGEYAWHSGNSGSQTHPVGQKKPNAWALHDMHGNAWEWCADWYGSDYYASSPADDPQGPSSGAVRVLRGGAWYIVARLSRSANRASDSPDCRYHNNGFRVARTP